MRRSHRTLYMLASLAAGVLCATFIDPFPGREVFTVLYRTLAVLMPVAVALYLTRR